MRTLHPVLPILLASSLLLAACSDSSNSGGGGGTTAGNTTGGDMGGTTSGNTTSGGGDLTGADLSHAGQPLPSVTADPQSDPLFSSTGHDRAAALPDNLGVIYEVVENHSQDTGVDCSATGAQYASCSVTNLHINDAAGALDDGNWRLYFHSIRRILRVDSNEFSVSLVNGDLNYVEPTDSFTGFDGGVKTIKLITEFAHLIETDFMPRYWLVRDGEAPVLIANTDSETDENTYAVPITGDNRRAFDGEANPLATAGTRYDTNSDIQARASAMSASDIQARIVPQPTSIAVGAGALDISGGFTFEGSALPAASSAALTARQNTFMGTGNAVSLQTGVDAGLPANTYMLTIDASGIDISGSDMPALFYAAQSLLALVQPGVGTLPFLNITDNPRFDFRGMHVDVARNFHSVASMQRLIDQMAAYKLNKLHLHLSDDEGWRLEIPSIPELTSVGGRRAFQLDAEGNVSEGSGLMPQLGSGPASDNQGTGFYTRSEFVELLKYAAARYIDVIPEIDTPAHARASVVAMRARAANLGNPTDINVRVDDPDDNSRYRTIQNYSDGILNPCMPGTYNFIESVVSDVSAMYTEAGVPLDIWHMGGDEARNIFKGGGFSSFDTSGYHFPWEQSPVCQSFIADTDGVSSRDDLTPHFIKRVAEIVSNAGIPKLYAYQDIYGDLSASELATSAAGVGFWEVVWSGGYNGANALSNRGFETVIAVPDYLYFDFPYEVDPKERGYYWATRFTDTQKVFSFAPENLPQNAETSVNREGNPWEATGDVANNGFTGMQGHLWSETVRTPEQFDYMLFPRLLALAERAWHRAGWELDYVPGQSYSSSTGHVDQQALANDYAGFAAALGHKELAKLEAAGVQYRIPVPGATSANGELDMNLGLPGQTLQYTADGSNWQTWDAAAKPAGAQAVRALSASGERVGRAVSVP